MIFLIEYLFKTIKNKPKNEQKVFFVKGKNTMKHQMKHMIRAISMLALVAVLLAVFVSCGKRKEKIIIYSSAEEYSIAYLQSRLNEEFPEYDIVVEYMSTGNHAAKLLAEKTTTDIDIIHDLEYGYLAKLAEEDVLADLSEYDFGIYMEDTVESDRYIIECRNGGAVILNTKVLEEKGLAEPTSYQDLLKPEYKGLISMPNPKASGTGYMFLKSLVNEWGEEAAFEYFDQLTPNVLQYTSSGSGPVNALVQGEVAVGLGMTAQAVLQINKGVPLKVVYFEEGSPFSLYGQAMVKGKETRECVKRVFDFMIETYSYENNEKFLPEKIFKDKDYTLENYPENIVYSDMSNNTIAEKERLLAKWAH